MLRVNVGLSRKMSKDYNSTGFSINLDGEVTASVTDPEAVIEQVKELFDLAEEALDREVQQYQSDSAFAGHDHGPANGNGHSQGTCGNGFDRHPRSGKANGRPQPSPPSRESQQGPEAATEKQINYLLNIGKRNRLSTLQLEQRVEKILGQKIGVYDLTKQGAAAVIDALANGGATSTARTESHH